jgi:type IV pilus biogenesis protein CpaD/CtpE
MEILRMTRLAAVAATALILINGCGATATERDFGNSAQALISGQTADPMASMQPDPDPIATGDGQRLNGVIEGYREPGPERTKPEVRSNPFLDRN